MAKTRTIQVKEKTINYVKVDNRLPFAFWIENGVINVSVINSDDFYVNVIKGKPPTTA